MGMIDFQEQAARWAIECFGKTVAHDRLERSYRFLEEALELVQTCGLSKDEAHELVNYTYSRTPGELNQEIGGVLVTLATLCSAHQSNMDEAGRLELERCWQSIDKIRQKQRNKPHRSPLSGSVPD